MGETRTRTATHCSDGTHVGFILLEAVMNALLELICITVGALLIGSEYTTALGWAVWLIAISLH